MHDREGDIHCAEISLASFQQTDAVQDEESIINLPTPVINRWEDVQIEIT